MNLVQKYLREASLRKLIKEEKKIKNPDTGRMIKLSSALSYDKDTAVYKAAIATQNKKVKNSSPVNEKINKKYKEHFKNKIKKDFKNIDAEDLADETITLFKNNKIDTKTIRSTFQNLQKEGWDETNNSESAIKYLAIISQDLADDDLKDILSPQQIHSVYLEIDDDQYEEDQIFQDDIYSELQNKLDGIKYNDDDWEKLDNEYDDDWEENTK